MSLNSIKPAFIIWCAVVGHRITKEDEDKLFSSDVTSIDTKCSRCNTPLRLTKTGENMFQVQETY